jgi:hypothetical protein
MHTKLTKLILTLFGFTLSMLIGKSFPISDVAVVVWIWVFLLGLGTKVLIQSFAAPFMNVPTNEQVPNQQIKSLNLFSSISFYLGTGLLIGELIFNGSIGVISVALIIYGTSIHIGTWIFRSDRFLFTFGGH